MKMTKSFITNLTNSEDNKDTAVFPDASHVMCTIHNAVKSTSNFPQCEHRRLQLCSTRSHSCQKSSVRKRSVSPKNARQNEKCQDHNRTTFRTLTTIRKCHDNDQHTPAHACSSQYQPLASASFVTTVEKTSSCPDRSCSCVSSRPKSSLNSKNPSIKSQSVVGISSLVPEQISRHIISTDIVVSELKDEIEKVKSQLFQISVCKGGLKKDSEKLITQLKLENRNLKKELESKRKNQHSSVKDVEKAKAIMSDYEKKVLLLHEQAMKSSKLMKQSKEKFCKCLKEKERLIKELQNANRELNLSVNEKDEKYEELNNAYISLQNLYCQNTEKCDVLQEDNKLICQCIRDLEQQLQDALCESEYYKQEVNDLQQKMDNLKCDISQKLETKINKQKERYESRLKEAEENENKLKKEMASLLSKIKENETEKMSVKTLEQKYNDLQNKLVEYEKCVSKCKILEDECKRHCEATSENEKRFEMERNEMRRLVEELTTVVKHNKVTVLKLSDINKQQESLLESQTTILSQKEEEIKQAESTIEILQKNSLQLEREVEDLRKTVSGPCRKEACLSISKQLEEVRNALSVEKDNHLVKEKIIEDQSQTICCLQYQIKEKMSELDKARQETALAENEMARINNDLIKKHKNLEQELNEKKHLLNKLKKLEYQKTLLSKEMDELQKLLQQYCDSEQYDEEEKEAIANLQKQIEQQKIEWESQKENLATEKEKAIRAAKFATQKLLDTVSDFQKQVDTQKKVQNMLTKMLHDKENELRLIKSKIFSINSITSDLEIDFPLNEIFKRNNGIDLSKPATTSSFYSSCSNCSRSASKLNYEELDANINILKRAEHEVPIKDS